MSIQSQGVELSHAPAQIAGLYTVFGLLWAWLIDRALVLLGYTDDHWFLAAAGKRTLFIGITASLLYWLVRREIAALRTSKSLLRAAVEGTTDAVFVKDSDGRYLLANEAAARILGRSIAEVLGRNDRELLHASDAERLIASDQAIMTGGEVVTLEETLTSASRKRTYHATKAPYRDSTGAVAGLIGVARDITERKAAEDAIRVSEERFRELADAIPQIVWTAALDGAMTHVNAKAVEYTGLDAGDLTGWSWERVIHHDDLPNVLNEWTQSLRDGVPRSVELRMRSADGEYRWHIARNRPIHGADGVIASWVGTCTDVNDLKHAENALRETDARLKEAQRIARLGSWSWEPPTNHVWWSDAEFELFGVDRLAVHPSLEAFLALLHPEDRAVAIARVEAMKAGADEFANDLRVVRPDGSNIWIHSRARATRDAGGALVRVEGTDLDVTERLLAEEVRDELLARLQLQIDRMPLAYILFDSDICYSNWNPAAEKIFGYSRDEIIGQSVHFLVHPDDRAQVDAIADRLRCGDVAARSINRNVTKDGRVIICEWNNTPLFASDGAFVGVLSMTQNITDRVRAEEALRESERRLRLALESAGAIAFIWDVKSDAVTRFFSTEPALPITSQQVGTLNDVRARIHPDDLAGFDTRLSACIAEGTEYRNAYRVVRLDGTTASLEEYGYFDRATDGAAICLTGISIDVTDRLAATEALRVSETRYRKLVELLPTAIFVHADNRILYGNPAFIRMMGASDPDDLLGIGPLDIAHPSAHDVILRRHDEMARTGEAVPGFEMKLVRRDGRSVPVYSVAAPISGYGQSATLVVLSDLTEREHANELLRSVLGSVNDAIITIDEFGIVGSANPAAVRQFGYAEEEVVGHNINLLMPEPYRDEHDGYLANYLCTGMAKVIGIGREVEGRRRDGSCFPAELTVTEFRLDDERHFTGVLRDITARKRLESQFLQVQKMEAVGRLAGGVAHDFNNLLTVINGYCEFLMMSDFPVGDQRREKVAIILDAGEQAARLTQQLLAFSRKAIIEPKVLDLNELVSKSAKLIRRLIGEDIILTVISAATPVWVQADPSQLEQVIMNLVVNAREAMPTGGRVMIETTTVDATAGDSTPFARLSVSDTGQGMADDVKGKIFEPFFTTKDIGKGTGLGLAVVHGVVTQCGGQIEVESTVGIGTTFHLLLPLVTDQTSGAAVEKTQVATGGTETVLLVEDEKAVRKIARMSLQAHGYTVLEADGGAEAIRLAQTHPGEIHLLVSDVVMPEMGGRLLLDAVRHYRPGLRVLFMSGYTDDAVLLHGVVEATDAFIQKPFTPLGLARKVREVINAPVR